jgi:hypothetical protein
MTTLLRVLKIYEIEELHMSSKLSFLNTILVQAGPLKLKNIFTQTFNASDGLSDSIRTWVYTNATPKARITY